MHTHQLKNEDVKRTFSQIRSGNETEGILFSI